MKKNIKKYLFSTILFAGIMMFSSEVKAADIVKNDVPNSTYVIGTHMFTRDKNEETGYNGQLTTKNIMLAAKTIKGDTVNDMVIYYKNPRGKWTDPLTGSETQVPDKFEINYKNLALEEVKAPGAPILFLNGPLNYDNKTGDFYYQLDVFIDDINNKENTPCGVEIQVCKDGEDSIFDLKYEEELTTIFTFTTEESANAYDNLVLAGKSYHRGWKPLYVNVKSDVSIVARAYNIDGKGNKVYSDNSEDYSIKGLPKLTLKSNYTNPDYIVKENGCYQYSIGIEKFFKVKEDAFKLNSKSFVYVLYDGAFEIGKYALDEVVNLTIKENLVKKYTAVLGCYINGELYVPNVEDKNVFTIDTRKLTAPTWADPAFDRNSKTTFISINSRFYEEQPKDSLDYNKKGTEIFEILQDGHGEYKFIDESNYVHAEPTNGAGFYVARAYAFDANGNKVYSDFSEKLMVVKYPEIEVSDVIDEKVTVKVKNADDFKPSIGYEVYSRSSKVLLGKANSIEDTLEIEVDSNIEIYARATYMIDSDIYYSSKSNPVEIEVPEGSVKRYTISYNLDGGAASNLETYTQISLPYTLNNPTKEGYVFIGWTGSNGNTPQKEVIIPKGTRANLVYTANWQLLGDVNGDGEVTTRDVTSLNEYIHYGDDDIPEAAIIEFGDVNQDGIVDDVDVMILFKYVGGWSIKLPYDSGEKYTISYNLDGGKAYNIKTYAQISLPDTLNTPTKEGYVFLGWTGSNGNTPQKEVTITEGTTGNLEYTANWGLLGDVNGDGNLDSRDLLRARKYWNGENIEINKTNTDVNQDGKIDDVDYMIIRKYFAGWNVEFPYNSGETYTISYNLDGGKVEYYNIKIYAQISLPYTLINPTKEGYVFIGWTGSNGNTPQKEVTITEGTTGNLEYIANWGLLGDVNGDSYINTTDVVIIIRYIAGNYEEIPFSTVIECGDVNQDGEVDDVDLMILSKYISDGGKYNPEGYAIKLPYASGEKYTIGYNLDGGVLEKSNIKTYAQVSLPYTLNNPTKEGYVFLGWTGSNGSTPQKEVTITEETTGNLEYTANWEKVD